MEVSYRERIQLAEVAVLAGWFHTQHAEKGIAYLHVVVDGGEQTWCPIHVKEPHTFAASFASTVNIAWQSFNRMDKENPEKSVFLTYRVYDGHGEEALDQLFSIHLLERRAE